MKQAYMEVAMHAKTLKLIEFVNTLVDSYLRQGFTLSVRQIYYQMVARDMIPNTERSYKNVGEMLNNARLCGLLDWDAIEDRNRDIVTRPHWESGQDIIEQSARQYHQDLWATQDNRVFVIVEKAALAGVLSGVCHQYDIPLLAARGYPSVTIVREMALTYVRDALEQGQYVTILHCGDHDPSGIDMTRDLQERFDLFLGDDADSLIIKRIALTMAQIEEVKPPPNPAKVTDSRFSSYKREFGDECWELDALEPSYLVNLVTMHVKSNIDQAEWDATLAQITATKERLADAAAKFADGA